MAAPIRAALLQRGARPGALFFQKLKLWPCIRQSRPISLKPDASKVFHRSSWFGQSVLQRAYSTNPVPQEDGQHNIIKDSEKVQGASKEYEFQAETRKLLDIVAKSLYSEREVFIRELISNANDALEKLRFLSIRGEAQMPSFEIHIATDPDKKYFIIQDTGLGMTKEEMIDNLGTIARSGSKAFLEQLEESGTKGDAAKSIIGQFGVGFYSSFMVGKKIEVFSRHHKSDKCHYWVSDGHGTYELSEAEGVHTGTKIIIHLKEDAYEFAEEKTIKEVIKKFSNFVGAPIYLNGKKVNTIRALWLEEPKKISDEEHGEFYRFISNSNDKPRFHFHFKTDVPINIHALFYVPESKPTLFDLSQETDVGVALYSRKVLIHPRANQILPRWMRFLKGVVDSEDIPLNLSRELLQNNALISKIRTVLTQRIIRFFNEQQKKNREAYKLFYEDYKMYFKEGIVRSGEQKEKEDMAGLLRFESSRGRPGVAVTLNDYIKGMQPHQRFIYYLASPSRILAETSPYFEAVKKKEFEVLFCYEPHDEVVFMQLGQYDGKNIRSVENEIETERSKDDEIDSADANSLTSSQANEVKSYIKGVLGEKVSNVKITNKLDKHPCIVSTTEMGAVRHFLRTNALNQPSQDNNIYKMLSLTLEINPKHPIIRKLNQLRSVHPELAQLVTEQLLDNSLITAGLIVDSRAVVGKLNQLIEKALEKY